MTGRYAMRYGLQTLVIFPSHTYGLATDERTLAQALKDAGYDTVGKWHLGHADKKYWPQNRGFDHFYGNLVGEVDFSPRSQAAVTGCVSNYTWHSPYVARLHKVDSNMALIAIDFLNGTLNPTSS